MAKRVSTLSQVLKETQAAAGQRPPQEEPEKAVLPQNENAATAQSSNTALPESDIAAIPQSSETIILQNDNVTLPQNHKPAKRQSHDTAKLQKPRTEERDKVTYYLNPGQLDKLEDMRIAYRKATKKRLNEQDFMRLIVDRLELKMLL
jgi:hypothetical protein